MAKNSKKAKAKELLSECGLRSTAPRLAVLCVLLDAKKPLSNTEVCETLGETDWDPATIYRNLVKLREAGIAPVVSRVDGIDRYALAGKGDEHRHPHFSCEDCGQIACLPDSLVEALQVVDGPWANSVSNARIQLQGECPDCIKRDASH